ncbi:MAG TPA: exodeoxyribonuclease VII small subunit [Rhizomicrobium sp.]|nr:exodeoxyribonuclease VII small subunit [Rhizomicrobium sp.]
MGAWDVGRELVGESVISTAAKAQDTAKPVSEMNFETALKELETIVARLEQGDVDLEDSIVLYERGQALKVHCEAKLKSAEGRLEKIVQGTGGPTIGERLDVA